ncbi:unnamed protein product, partial [Didymodactylos carnosus]
GTFTAPDFNQEQTGHVCPRRVVQRQSSLRLQNSAEVVELPSAVTTSFQRSSPVQPVMNQQSSQPIRSSAAPPTLIANQQQTIRNTGSRIRGRREVQRQQQQNTNDVNQDSVNISTDDPHPTRGDHPTRTTTTGMMREAINRYNDFLDEDFALYTRINGMLDDL